jgi:4-hydroxy-tetrahydrodipicolinate reductase
MIAAALGWTIEDFEHVIEPVVAMEERESPDILVPPGYSAGIDEELRALVGGRPRIIMHLRMELGAKEPRDEIHIHGTPDVDVVVNRGFQGDPATAALVVNALPHVIAAQPGLLTMADLPLGFARQHR